MCGSVGVSAAPDDARRIVITRTEPDRAVRARLEGERAVRVVRDEPGPSRRAVASGSEEPVAATRVIRDSESGMQPGARASEAEVAIPVIRDVHPPEGTSVLASDVSEREVTEEELHDTPPSARYVRDRLRSRLSFWRGLVVPATVLVLSWIATGVTVKWAGSARPPPWTNANHASLSESPANLQFAREAVADLVERGAARRVSYQPHGCSALGIAVHPRTCKRRLIFDLRPLNSYLAYERFTYEGVATVATVARSGDCAFSLDFSAAYHPCTMSQALWTYLGFQFEGTFYEFTALPFGLAPACRIFTFIVRALAAHWRAQGIRLVHYIDDWVFFCRPSEHARLVARILRDVAAAGFLVNEAKSSGLTDPLFQFDWIGHTFDLAAGTLRVLQTHEDHVIQMCSELLAAGRGASQPALMLMKLAGKLASCYNVLGKALPLFTYQMHLLAHTVSRKTHRVHLSAAVLRECKFWVENLRRLNSTPLWPLSQPDSAVSATIAADAGDPGWGSHVVTLAGRPQASPRVRSPEAHGLWAAYESIRSSTWRELRGLFLTLRAFVHLFRRGSTVLALVDAMNVAHLWHNGRSGVPDQHQILVEIWELLESHNLSLLVQWIPRRRNARADYLSKFRDRHDWTLARSLFRRIERRWGRFDVDLFASHQNNRTRRFFSYFYCPGSSGVDAFTQDWSQLSFPNGCWCFPPFDQMAAVLRHARFCGARVAVVVPHWPRQAWWPSIRSSDGSGWAHDVLDDFTLPVETATFSSPSGNAPEYGVSPATYKCSVLLMDCSRRA